MKDVQCSGRPHPPDRNLAQDELSATIQETLGVVVRPEPDGEVLRFPAPGKSSSNRACWVVFSKDSSHAVFGSHITGERHVWRPSWAFHSAELEMWNSTTAEDLKRLEEERIDQQAKVAEVVKNIIVKSDGASCEHPYLKRKKVGAHGLRQLGSALIVPLQDISGEVLNIQRIFADGSKRFQRGGRVKGLFAVIGDAGNSPTWYVSEGWATAATIFEAGGYASFAAMNAGNLMTVCIRLSEIAPAGTKIVVVADNDHQTEGNPGLTKAIQAAKAIGAEFVCPPLPCGWDDCACTDFNDYVHCVKREGLK